MVESEGIEPSSEQAKTMVSTCLVTIYCRDAPRLVTDLRTTLYAISFTIAARNLL